MKCIYNKTKILEIVLWFKKLLMRVHAFTDIIVLSVNMKVGCHHHLRYYISRIVKIT